MRSKLYKIQATGFALALTLTFSCSSDSDNGDGSVSSSSYGDSSSSSSSSGGESSSSYSSNGSGNSSSSGNNTSSSSELKDCDAVFNPANKFCYDGDVYDKCDGMPYNPTTHICNGDMATLAKCDDMPYNPLTQFCREDGVAITARYCDYGYPTTANPNLPGPCISIEKISECNAAIGGILAASCRTNLKYCDWGTKRSDGSGGCYIAKSEEDCTSKSGTPVDRCPETSLLKYCNWGSSGGCHLVDNEEHCKSTSGTLVNSCP